MSYSHLTLEQRKSIEKMLASGKAKNETAQEIGVHPSTMSREIGRNCNGDFCCAEEAYRESMRRRYATKPCPKTHSLELRNRLRDYIRTEWSPVQTSGRLKLLYPECKDLHVSVETIYKIVYDVIATENPELAQHLRRRRKRRQNRRKNAEKQDQIKNRCMIAERPAEVEKKQCIGDWEGDTIEGAGKKGNIVTLVERKSKYCLAKIIGRRTADNVTKALMSLFSTIPENKRKTLTLDNGKEFALHEKIEKKTKTIIYFANPYHSWERGLNEHTNGLLRKYLPKKELLYNKRQKDVDEWVNKLNTKPRKCLGFLTPDEVFHGKEIALQI